MEQSSEVRRRWAVDRYAQVSMRRLLHLGHVVGLAACALSPACKGDPDLCAGGAVELRPPSGEPIVRTTMTCEAPIGCNEFTFAIVSSECEGRQAIVIGDPCRAALTIHRDSEGEIDGATAAIQCPDHENGPTTTKPALAGSWAAIHRFDEGEVAVAEIDLRFDAASIRGAFTTAWDPYAADAGL